MREGLTKHTLGLFYKAAGTCLAGNVVALCPKVKIRMQREQVRYKICIVVLSFSDQNTYDPYGNNTKRTNIIQQ